MNSVNPAPPHYIPPKSKEDHPLPKEPPKDDWEFNVTTVADCISEKITPKQYMPVEGLSINLSWTQIIALINRKAKHGKKIENIQFPANELLAIYSKLMSSATFF